ncbi:MAG TPA: type VI secretion system baseplate subunit TssF [Stellaceae bacterium]|nr:type VI secretion system baseplate subunit TssF [Stellaceae bacterium]
MASDGLDDILAYYQRELAYLRQRGLDFARRYPKVANRLDYGGAEAQDPHVERLIESFAFLTARLQRNIDSEFPEIPTALLAVLYPHLVAPVPAMAIAQFSVDAAQARAAQGFLIPRQTAVFAETAGPQRDRLTCRFRTGYPVMLWPIEVASADLAPAAEYDFLDAMPEAAAVLRLKLRCQGQWSFADVVPPSLRFFIHAEPGIAGAAYELLFNELIGIAVMPEASKAPSVRLPADALAPVGFAAEEGLLPYPGNAHLGYRLIQEYFVFPQKYHFFELTRLPPFGPHRSVELLFLLRASPPRRLAIHRGSFALGATPIVNLFPKTTEPIRIDQTRAEYLLVPDNRWERSTEIHSILKVSATSDVADDSRTFQPYFSYDHHSSMNRDGAFWTARRQPTGRADMPGTDVLLSFLDLDFTPTRPPTQTVFAHTLATNRGLAEHIAPETRLEIEVDAPVAGISCLTAPTRQIAPPFAGDTLWRLVSHLSLNQLSLGDGEQGLAALREILRLYASLDDGTVEKQIHGLRSLKSRPVVRRIGHEGWRGFCRGIEVTLGVDETLYVGASAFLLATVLSRFFGLYAAADSFAQLVLTSAQRDGIWKTWPPLAGERLVL